MISISIGSLLAILWAIISLLLIGPLAWIVKRAIDDQKSTERELHKHQVHIPKTYVSKAEYKDDMDEIKSILQSLNDSLK